MKDKEMTWDDITLHKFMKIRDIIEVKDEYMVCNLIDELFDTDSVNMPLEEFKKMKEKLHFMDTPIEKRKKVVKKLEIEGRKYDVVTDMRGICTAQYIDFQNYISLPVPRYEDLLSVFVIPVGHRYNDGYDLDQVKEDIMKICIRDVLTMAFFFSKCFELFTVIFPIYFSHQMKKMKIGEEKKRKIEEKLKEWGSMDLASYHILQECVESLI